MRLASFHRLAGVFAVTAALMPGLPAFASTGTFQPLHDPATGELHPGKLVWADLFTTDPVAATKF